MATFGEQLTRMAGRAAADLRQARYTIVRAVSATTVNIASLATATTILGPIGVLQNEPNSGQACIIAYGGESKVVGGGTVTANGWITTNGSGRAVDAASGDTVIGRSCESAATDGEVVRARLVEPFPLLRT